MIRNYLLLTIRTLRKHAGYAVINVAGLALGMAACILMLLYVQQERSYDRFHAQADRIYRIHMFYQGNGTTEETASVQFPVGPTLVRDVPGVVQMARLHTWGGLPVLRYDDKQFVEERFFYADPSVFDVFSLEMLHGDPATALRDPHSIVLTRTTARKYFGDADPLGKTLTYENEQALTVTGVIEDLPVTSHFHIDLLVPVELRRSIWRGEDGTGYDLETDWVWNAAWTYLVLADDEAVRTLADHLPDFVEKHYPDAVRAGMRLALMPLTDLHLHSHLDREIESNGNVVTVYLFLGLAVLVLLIACVNFTNLATARSVRRAREVGMRKVLGAHRGQLIGQFLGEALLLGFVAMIAALGLILLALPVFNSLAGTTLSSQALTTPSCILGLPGLVLVVGLLAGGYPAFYLSAFRPIHTLKGAGHTGTPRGRLRKVLVIGQFVISTVLLIGLGVMRQQLDYIQIKDIGFSPEQILRIDTRNEINDQFDAFKSTLLQHPDILGVAGATATLPGKSPSRFQFLPERHPHETPTFLPLLFVGHDFESVFGVETVAGRFFSKDFPGDAETSLVINEAAVKQLGWDEAPLGKRLERVRSGANVPSRVIGVIEDFHFESLHVPVAPLVLALSEPGYEHVLVKVRLDNLPATLEVLEATWAQFAPTWPLDYVFLDENLAAFYTQENRLHQIIQVFTLLALFVACRGLFGLAAFMAEQRTKEIGIRKVLGASTHGLVLLLSKEFTRLVVLAFGIAAPLAFLAAQRWLDTFAYRIELSWPIFLVAGLAALVIAWLTVGYQAIRAARGNPVQSLRYE